MGFDQVQFRRLEGVLCTHAIFSFSHPQIYLQAVVERYRACTPEQFWAEFRDDKGRYLSYMAIAAWLTAERVAANEHVAKRARMEYSNSFDSVFSYRKGSSHFVMTDPSKIAAKYYQPNPRP